MSKRRQAGEWVRLCAGAGMVGDADTLLVEVRPEPDEGWAPCMLSCGDPDCREWVTAWTEPDPEHGGQRWPLYHVSECQMSDPEDS